MVRLIDARQHRDGTVSRLSAAVRPRDRSTTRRRHCSTGCGRERGRSLISPAPSGLLSDPGRDATARSVSRDSNQPVGVFPPWCCPSGCEEPLRGRQDRSVLDRQARGRRSRLRRPVHNHAGRILLRAWNATPTVSPHRSTPISKGMSSGSGMMAEKTVTCPW